MVEDVIDFWINMFWCLPGVRDSTDMQDQWVIESYVFEIV